jgi:hypothetical protein
MAESVATSVGWGVSVVLDDRAVGGIDGSLQRELR